METSTSLSDVMAVFTTQNSIIENSSSPSSSLEASFSPFNCTQDELGVVRNRTEWSIICNQTLPEAQCRPQEYYSYNYSLIGTLFQSIIFLIGVLGNILVCTVVVNAW